MSTRLWTVLATLLMAMVAGLAWAWAPDRSVDALKARWAAPPSRFVTLQGMQGMQGMQGHLRIGFRLAQMAWLAPITQKILPLSMISASVRNVYGQPDKVSPALAGRYYELMLSEGNRDSLTKRFQYSSRDAALAGKILQLRLPTLILWGSEDRLIPQEHGQRFHQDITGSHIKVFEGLGHVPHEEDPKATVQAVTRFLSLPPALIRN